MRQGAPCNPVPQTTDRSGRVGDLERSETSVASAAQNRTRENKIGESAGVLRAERRQGAPCNPVPQTTDRSGRVGDLERSETSVASAAQNRTRENKIGECA